MTDLWCAACAEEIRREQPYKRVPGTDIIYHVACCENLEICKICNRCKKPIKYQQPYTIIHHQRSTPNSYCQPCTGIIRSMPELKEIATASGDRKFQAITLILPKVYECYEDIGKGMKHRYEPSFDELKTLAVEKLEYLIAQIKRVEPIPQNEAREGEGLGGGSEALLP